MKAFCYKREVRSGYVAGFERTNLTGGLQTPLPPPTTLMDISPTKSKYCFARIPVEEWFPGIVNIPILTMLHVTVATTIVVLAWQDLL
jgi:hypothetical protein